MSFEVCLIVEKGTSSKKAIKKKGISGKDKGNGTHGATIMPSAIRNTLDGQKLLIEIIKFCIVTRVNRQTFNSYLGMHLKFFYIFIYINNI